MCGICGIFDPGGRPIEATLIDRMRDMMTHRGPDDSGTRILPHVALGHRRLKIIDLSPRGRQPMHNEDETVWLVFNGEIYNFVELRRELLKQGHRFTSETDSETLIHGYEEWDIDGLLARINGMFAFALWDARNRRLLLARDRLGKKPLFYGRVQGRLMFASELKALWASRPGSLIPRPDSIAKFLYWRFLPGAETIYEDIQTLLPAHYLIAEGDSLSLRRYWKTSFAAKERMSVDDAVQGTEQVVSAAVRRRLRSDVPLGAFLSGGIDSSYVVSWMADSPSPKVQTFSAGFDAREHDERRWAARVARQYGTDHTQFQVEADAWGMLPRLVWEFGQPFGDAAAIPTYYVSQCARQHVTVALTGDGGDESFAGYSNHRAELLAGAIGRWVPNSLIDLVLRWSRPLTDSGRGHPLASAARFARYVHADPLISLSPVTAWSLHHLQAIFPREHIELANPAVLLEHALKVRGEFDGQSDLDRALHYDLNMLLPFCYNVKLDVTSMMSSLETRCPFQDREVVEWAARIEPGLKMRPWDAKHLLKLAAVRRLPREVVYRPKHGFSVPLEKWMRGAWAAAAHDIVLGREARRRQLFNYDYIERMWAEHQAGVASHGTRLWLLLWLELWYRLFVDRTLAPSDALPS